MNASTHIVEIEESNAQQLLIEESMTRPVVVDFWADWCGPCNVMKPQFHELADQFSSSDIRFGDYRLDANQSNSIASREKVVGLPTYRIYRAGSAVDTMIGAGDLASFLKKHVKD